MEAFEIKYQWGHLEVVFKSHPLLLKKIQLRSLQIVTQKHVNLCLCARYYC